MAFDPLKKRAQLVGGRVKGGRVRPHDAAPTPVSAASTDVIEQTARTVQEFADVLHASATAWSDHRVTPEEAARTCREIDQAIAALAQMRRMVQDATQPIALRAVHP